jgi:hypothetical protein
VVEDGVAVRRILSTGIVREGLVEVLAGLSDEDRFVILGQAGLKDGAKLNVVNESADAATEETPQPESDDDTSDK